VKGALIDREEATIDNLFPALYFDEFQIRTTAVFSQKK
jgi:hypothetical protein